MEEKIIMNYYLIYFEDKKHVFIVVAESRFSTASSMRELGVRHYLWMASTLLKKYVSSLLKTLSCLHVCPSDTSTLKTLIPTETT